MTISAPVLVGTVASPSTTTPLSMTTTAAIPATAAIIVVTGSAVDTASSVSDGTNTYTALSNYAGTSAKLRVFYCANSAGLSSGSTVTVTWSNALTNHYQAVFYISNANTVAPIDALANSSVTSATPSLATGALGLADEVVIGFFWAQSSGSEVWTEATGFTNMFEETVAGEAKFRAAYQVVSSTASVTYAPTVSISTALSMTVFSVKGVTVSATRAFTSAYRQEYLTI